MPQDDSPPLDAVHRALQLVLALRAQPSITVTDAAELLAVAPSTAHRLLSALCYDGFAVRGADRKYRSGPADLSQTPPGVTLGQLRDTARRPMEELSRRINETVQLWVRQASRVRFVDGVEGTQPLSVRVNVWDDSPAVASAAGRAMLADLTPAEIARLQGQPGSDWASSRVRTVRQLQELLQDVRRQGYALSIEENTIGVNGVAASVSGPDGRAVAAISIAVPTVRFGTTMVKTSAAALEVAVRTIEEALAHA